MSAFLVNNSSISRLADAIRRKSEKFSKKYTNNLELAHALYSLNVEALRQRYEDYKEMISPFVFTSEIWFDDKKGNAQFYKSLCCFTYQCLEGNVPETELYKELEKLENDLAHEIAMKWAGEQGAVWD